MAVRDLIISIKSRWDGKGTTAAEEGLKQTEEAAKKAQRELERMERAAAKQRAAMASSGQTMAMFGAAAVAGIGLATRAAVEWESAWTGVTKTVEGTPQQMAALEGALRGLARELPASHKEIAAVAEAAGQLGIKREAVVGFVRTMVDLGQTTNLSAEQAATALAKLSNIMGTPQQEIGRMGASLVALGNAGASTESEIVDMALRIAGAGKTIGLTEGQVLGFASALSSVGINAESGGSSISRVMITIAQAVEAGGQQVEKFARVAGMSASEFSTAFKQDAGSALAAFIEGLGRVEASGGSLFGTLQQLGFSEIEVRDALLRTAQAGSLLSDSLRVGEQAWADNSALVDEAAKRYETTASKLAIAQNNVNDLAIELGQVFLPILGSVAEHTSGWISLLQSLPAPVQTAGGVVAALAGGLALAGGAAMIAVPKMVEFTKTLEGMGPRGAAVASRLSSLGSFLTGPWGIALAAAAGAVLLFANSKAEAATKVDIFRRAIEADSGALAAHTREATIARLQEEGLLDIAKRLGVDLKLVTDAAMGNKDALAKVNAQLAASAGPADAFHTKVRSLADGTKVLSGDQMLLQQALQGINGDLASGSDAYRLQQEAQGGAGGAAKSLTADLGVQGGTAEDLTKVLQNLASTYGLTGDDAAKAAQQMIDSWSSAFTQFNSLTGAIQSIESSASQSSTSNADRQAAAQERLAEVQRTSAEKIKRAQRDLADVHLSSAEKITKAQRDLADMHERAADQTVQAQARIRSAQEALSAAVEEAARREASALQAVESARTKVTEVAQDSARKIESSVRRVSDAQAEAADRELAAERRLQDSHARTAQTVEDLSAAYEQARQRVRDLVDAQAEGATDEESAQIALERAREHLAELQAKSGTPDSGVSHLDLREAENSLRRAEQSLKRVQDRNAELRQELEQSNRAGIEGSAEVVAAKQKIAEAQQAEQEAEAALAKQREEGARSVAAAEQALADTRVTASRDQQEAERALARAQTELDQTRINGAKDVLKAKADIAAAEAEAAKAARDAARSIGDAEASVRDAHRETARAISDAEDAMRKARQDAARDTMKANEDVRQSWVSLGGTAAVTTEGYLRELEKQVRDQEKWADNLIKLAGRVPPAMLDELVKLGPGGAKVVALAAQMTEPELAKFVSLHGRSGKLAADQFVQNLAEAGPVLERIARSRGQEVADKVREGMDGGRNTVYEAARRIGLEIDRGLDLDRKRSIEILLKKDAQLDARNRAMGGIDRYAAGGLRAVGPMIAGRPTVLFGEGNGPEAFIPYDRAYRGRAEGLLSQVAGDFGGLFLRPMGAMAAPSWPAAAGGTSGGNAGSGLAARGGVTIAGNFYAMANQDPDEIAERLYLKSIARGY